jgi:hypothetical protein
MPAWTEEIGLPEVRVPRVGVRVELDERHRPVTHGERTQLGERDRVVAADRERERARRDERREPLFDPAIGSLRVSRRHREVAEVGDGERLEHVDVEDGVIGPQQRRRRPHGLGTEAGPGAEARRGVEGNPDDRNVGSGRVGDDRKPHERAHAGEARVDQRVDRTVPGRWHRFTFPLR